MIRGIRGDWYAEWIETAWQILSHARLEGSAAQVPAASPPPAGPRGGSGTALTDWSEWLPGLRGANPRFGSPTSRRGAGPLRGPVLRPRRHGEPDQGTAAVAVRRPHLERDDARQPAAADLLRVRRRPVQVGLQGTALPARLLKVAVTVTVRRIRVAFPSGYPLQDVRACSPPCAPRRPARSPADPARSGPSCRTRRDRRHFTKAALPAKSDRLLASRRVRRWGPCRDITFC